MGFVARHRRLVFAVGIVLILAAYFLPDLISFALSTLVVDSSPPVAEKVNPAGSVSAPALIVEGTGTVDFYVSVTDALSGVNRTVYSLAKESPTQQGAFTVLKSNISMSLQSDGLVYCNGVSPGYACYWVRESFSPFGGQDNSAGASYKVTFAATDNAGNTLVAESYFDFAVPTGTFRVCFGSCPLGGATTAAASGELDANLWYSLGASGTFSVASTGLQFDFSATAQGRTLIYTVDLVYARTGAASQTFMLPAYNTTYYGPSTLSLTAGSWKVNATVKDTSGGVHLLASSMVEVAGVAPSTVYETVVLVARVGLGGVGAFLVGSAYAARKRAGAF